MIHNLIALYSTRLAFPYRREPNSTCSCKPEIDPVCVREGPYQYTYSNKCVFQCAQENKKDLVLLYEGSCCSARYCNMFEQPVCSEGQMYQTVCEFEERQCIEFKLFKNHISMDSSQEKCSCTAPCPTEWNPVCDKKGQTHANFCTFLNSKCYHKNQLNESLEVDYSGVCCEDMCSAGQTSLTVCDSEGNTHTDICSFYIAKCRQMRRGIGKKRLQIAGVGPCKPKNPFFRSFDYFVNRSVNYSQTNTNRVV
ncbi:Kazal-like domain-containing protein [Caenorhabditis elegans]|uniref:Kazal-like domain-containing protein n=1 Tax=Caenorhabditis elegans TaxID=6239 RepID=Q3S1M5_CAEEL|nr:Kazal-like domain-containing protein [Caenorhabditis elegans]CCD63039.1 Kazal-like domain-containing protein [Caenorhabditis elegans]|eukprot:NP_001033579.1 Uncharacterized protein CELE_ZK813.6 [Caenorhabditis elegans]